jgi:hypothetical protein
LPESPRSPAQAVLPVNADPTLMSPARLKQIYNVLDTAYCLGVHPLG